VSFFNSAPALLLGVSGRANIIGEHTDYNEGFVFPFAIEQKIFFVAKKSDTIKSNIFSLDINDNYDEKNAHHGWQHYFHNIYEIFNSRYGIDKGIDVYFGGNLPIGAGISSSSAVCCGFIEIFEKLFQLNLSNIEKVNIASEAEHGIGLKGGKMDQYAIIHGEYNSAILLDCKTMTHESIRLPQEWKFLLLHSGVKHNLVETQYNDRRQQCESAIRELNASGNAFHSLRDVNLNDIISFHFSDVLYKQRSIHVIEENQRVLDFKKYLNIENIEMCGELLYQSHYSLKDKYEVSCEELDGLVDLAKDTTFIYGSRMMGGGFGGCTINLIQDINENELNNLKEKFKSKYGYYPIDIIVKPSQGITYF
jgi:galactokinase